MSMSNSTTRRGLLGTLLVGGAWLGGRKVYDHLQKGSPHHEYRTLAERLAQLPRKRRPLRGIGRAYLRSLAHRPTAEQIAAAWLPSGEERRRAIALRPTRLAELVSERTLEDYRNGRVVSVQGWLLSETEARFAALVAMVRRV